MRWKWTARAWAELQGWEHDVRTGEIQRSIDDALRVNACPPSRDFDEAVAALIAASPELGAELWRYADEAMRRLSERLQDFVTLEEVLELLDGGSTDAEDHDRDPS